MWGQFKECNGDINDPENYIEGSAGSLPPWSGWKHPEIWAGEGWRDDLPDNWIPPEPVKTLTMLKAEKWAEIKAERDRRERLPLSYLGKLFDLDKESSERLQWAINAARSAVSLGIEFVTDWTCYDNTVITLDAEDIIGLPIAVAQYSDGLHQTARGLRIKIFGDGTTPGAETVEEIDAIKWPE